MEAKKRTKKLPPDVRVVGERAGKARERTGMTETALARRLGISHTQISRFERGYRRLRLETLLRLCDALGPPPEQRGALLAYVFGGEGEPPQFKFVETDGRKRRSGDPDSG